MQQLQEKIALWAHERNIIAGSTLKDQATKLIEELGELAAGIAKGKQDLIEDSIGDMAVVLTIHEAIKHHPNGSPATFTHHTNVDKELVNEGMGESKHAYLGALAIAAGMLCLRGDNADFASEVEERESQEVLWTNLYNMALACGTTVEHCTELAYDEIKDRKGKMVDGVFIKEADLE